MGDGTVDTSADQPVGYRRATPNDAVACHELMWASVTDLGRRDFVVKWHAESIRWLSATRLMLVDVDTNRFLIEDTRRLDLPSRRQLAILD